MIVAASERRWRMGGHWAHIAKMLNDAMNNPIVLSLALAAVVLAFAIHVFVFDPCQTSA